MRLMLWCMLLRLVIELWSVTNVAPFVGLASVQSMLIVVVLFVPLGLRKLNTLFGVISKLMLWIVFIFLKDFFSFWILMVGIVM